MKLMMSLTLGLAATFGNAAEPPSRIHFPQDTVVEVRLKNAVSSATAHMNDPVQFDVTQDVVAGGVVVIAKGSLAWGTVAEAEPRSRMARSGKLNIDIHSVCLDDGTRAALRAVPVQAKASSQDGYSNESLLALPAFPVLLFIYGKDVTLPEGKTFTVYTGETLDLDPVRFQDKGPSRSCGPHFGPAPADLAVAVNSSLSQVRVESIPSGAEVFVDGKFYGSAPATLRVPVGDRLVSVRMNGHKSWERILSLTPGGDTHLNVTLEDTAPLVPLPEKTRTAAIKEP
jgi:hypothetical protein